MLTSLNPGDGQSAAGFILEATPSRETINNWSSVTIEILQTIKILRIISSY